MTITAGDAPRKKRGRRPMEPKARAKRTQADVYNLKLPKALIPNGVKILEAESKYELRTRWGIDIPDDLNWTKAWYERVATILEALARKEIKPEDDLKGELN
ncbi:MAG: hypothetical protein ACOH5I_26355 [Oligoflexus sp.]